MAGMDLHRELQELQRRVSTVNPDSLHILDLFTNKNLWNLKNKTWPRVSASSTGSARSLLATFDRRSSGSCHCQTSFLDFIRIPLDHILNYSLFALSDCDGHAVAVSHHPHIAGMPLFLWRPWQHRGPMGWFASVSLFYIQGSNKGAAYVASWCLIMFVSHQRFTWVLLIPVQWNIRMPASLIA